MKFTMTTAIVSALIATGAFAETSSRGDNAVTAPELKASVGTVLKAGNGEDRETVSRGAGDPTSEEVTADPSVSATSAESTLEADASRGDDALRSEDVGTGVKMEPGTPVDVSMGAAPSDDTAASRGADAPRSEDVAAGAADATVVKTEEEDVDVSRGAGNETSEEVSVGDTMPTGEPTEARNGETVGEAAVKAGES
ncbi:MAG: hypothetical protein KDK24_04955 [Pseudooceanicola sp.]|nr:hypothetical protein [Pseudooceanicola sp.]